MTPIGTTLGIAVLGIGVRTIPGGDGGTVILPIGTPDGMAGMVGTTHGITLGMTPTGIPVVDTIRTTPDTIPDMPTTAATEAPPADT